MTYGQDYGQQGQYPRQGSGQQWPLQYQQPQPWEQGQQGGLWQPQYDPRQHQQRMQGPPPGYGQVQPYAPPQPTHHGYAPFQSQYALPPVAPKSTAAGLILGLLPPCGIGCMYAGRAGIGVLLIGFWLLSIPLVFVLGIGFLTGFATWVASAILGYTMTREWNAAHGIVSLSVERGHQQRFQRAGRCFEAHQHHHSRHQPARRHLMITRTAAAAGILLVLAAVGCSTTTKTVVVGPGVTATVQRSPAATTAAAPATTAVSPSAEEIAHSMGLDNQPGYVAYTADTDPNHLLGRQGGYTSKINWGSNQDSSIEVFPDKADAQARESYVQGFRCPFGDGYDDLTGTALLRLSCNDTPSQAKSIESRFHSAAA